MSNLLTLDPSDIIILGDVYLEEKGNIDLPGHIVYNNEFVISDENDKPALNRVNLISRENFVPATFPKAEKLYAHMSNNHTYDFGVDAFERTLKLLEKEGISSYGHHFNQCKVVHELNEVKFTLLGYDTTGTSKTKKPEEVISLMEHDIPCARNAGAQKVIITIHFGNEHDPSNDEDQKVITHKAIDLGADIVIGHHSHCIQNIEIYKGKYIFYSVGNTWFPRHSTPAYFDETGKMNRVFRARETSWNTKSLVVIYNIKTGHVKIKKASSSNKNFRIIKDITVEEVNKYCFKWPKYTGHLRRYYLFAKSNLFIDGKIIDFNSFRHKFFEKKEYFKETGKI